MTLRAPAPAEGLAVLAGVAAVSLPGLTRHDYRSGGVLESVSFLNRAGRRIVGRCYDAGACHETAGRGLEVRLENQFWPDRPSRRLDYAALSTADVRGRFGRRFLPLARSTKGVKVAGQREIEVELLARKRRGELTLGEFERALGLIAAQAAGAEDVIYGRATRYRRRAEQREQGLVLAVGVTDPVDVDLGAVLEAALDGAVWGQG